jgi:hypothetical protein
VEVRPFLPVTPAIMLAGIVLFGIGDAVISIADTSVPDNEITSSRADNASASAGIRITMTGVVDE